MRESLSSTSVRRRASASASGEDDLGEVAFESVGGVTFVAAISDGVVDALLFALSVPLPASGGATASRGTASAGAARHSCCAAGCVSVACATGATPEDGLSVVAATV